MFIFPHQSKSLNPLRTKKNLNKIPFHVYFIIRHTHTYSIEFRSFLFIFRIINFE